MTVSSLLRFYGVDAERYVTRDGRIVFGEVAPRNEDRFTHSEHGTVTRVARHTFHGGTAEPGDAANSVPWWSRPELVARHVAAMQDAFPGFDFIEPSATRAPEWVGDINTGRGTFRISILLRRDGGLPTVRVVSGQRLGLHVGRSWKPSPHLYLSGNLCVADQSDWRVDVHTAATAAAWAAHWLAAYTDWRVSRHWPVAGAHAEVA